MKISKTTSKKTVAKAPGKPQSQRKKAAADAQPVDEAIRLKAYELYIERGAAPGNAEQDWLTAERLILTRGGL